MQRVRYGDSIIPGAILAGGSQQTAAIGGAVIEAYRALVAELLELAGSDSPLAGLSVDEVVSESGGVAKLGEPARRESYSSILERAQRDSVTAAETASLPHRDDALVDAFVRRDILRGAGQWGHRRNTRQPLLRVLRHRAHHQSQDRADTPMGAHGVGEIGITRVGAAVANAVLNATGRRVRELPITLDKLL
jgi:CO/xanthine dehydrogenase Mo-binding subunit